MKPWYAKGHVDPAGPGERVTCQVSMEVSNDLSHLSLLLDCSHYHATCLAQDPLASNAGQLTLPGWQAASQVLSWPVENPHLWALPEELAAHAGLLPGKMLDVPVARPVLWTPTARLMTIALGAATALAVAWLACCTCWFLGFFERVPVKREDDPPVFADTPGREKPLAVKVKEVGEGAMDEEAYIIE